MARTVKVRLELDRNDYKAGLRDAANDMRGFDGEVRAAGKDTAAMGVEVKSTGTQVEAMGREVDAAAKKTTGLGDETAKAKEKTRGLGEESDKARTKTRGFGEESDKARARVVELTADIDKAKTALAAMGEEFRKTSRIDVDKFKSLSAHLRELESVSKMAGTEAGKSLTAGLQGSLSTPVLGPVLIATLTAVAVAASPFFGAALAGGALGGAGLGVIGAGIALQFDRVRPAAADLGAYVKNQLTEATTSFGPAAADGIAALKREMAPLWADLQKGISSLTPYVTNLLVRLGEGLAKLGPGLGRALEAAGPILGAIAKNLPTLMNAFNILFDQMSKGSKGATEGIDAIMKAVSALIAGTGFALRGLANAYDFIVQKSDKLYSLLAKGAEALAPYSAAAAAAAGPLRTLSDYTHGVAVSFDESTLAAGGAAGGLDLFAGSAGGAAGAVQGMAVSMSSALATMTGLDGAAISVNQAVQTLKDSINQNGTSLDINTAAGQANVQAMLAGVTSAEALRKAQMDSGLSAAYADDQYLKNVGSLREVMLAAGMNAAQVDIMIGKYLNVPGLIKTNVELAGAIDAISKGSSLRDILNSLDGKVSRSSVITTYLSEKDAATGDSAGPRRGVVTYNRYGGIVHAAEGLITRPGIYAGRGEGSVVMAEQPVGHEAYIPQLGISQSRAMGLASEVGDWHGFDVVPRQAPGYAQFANTRPMAYGGGGSTYAPTFQVNVNAGMGADGRQIGAQVVEVIKDYERTNGANWRR